MPMNDNSLPIRDQIEALIIRLAKASKMYSIYQSDHKLTGDICIQLFELLEKILIMRREVTIGIISDELAFEKKPFLETSAKVSDFIDRLTEKGLKKITFCQGIIQEEIIKFIDIISEVAKHKRTFEETLQQFEKQNIIHIKIGHISLEEEELLLSGADDVRGLADKSFKRGVKTIDRQLQNIIDNKPVDMESIRLIAAALVNCMLVNKSLLMMLTSIKLNDEEKYIHNLIVCVFTLLQAEMLGIDRKYFVDIASAALLHNIGILSAEKTLDIEEIKKQDKAFIDGVIQNGVKILINTEGITPLAPLAALEYPIPYKKSKQGNPIHNKGLNLISMFITISRYYDRLRSLPEYQKDSGLEKIYEKMMSMSDIQFHPDLLGNFFNVVGLYPPGSMVKLVTGEVGIVIQNSIVDIHRPTVEIIYDAAGREYPQPKTLNLLERNREGKFKCSIQHSIAYNSKYKIPEKVSK
ncbi:hypothetical protein JW835_13880 [bacterium]|nr:hypothetical protein [bacterium]